VSQAIFRKIKPFIPFAALPLILLVAWVLIVIAQPLPLQNVWSEVELVQDADGTWTSRQTNIIDLRNFDFENYAARTRAYPDAVTGELLSPEEFHAWTGEIRRLQYIGGHIHYLTTRTLFLVEDGKWYTFSRLSIDYSHRLYVNGELLLYFGEPAATPETNIPRTGRITFTAQGVDGVIEFIQQSGNHVHRFSGVNSHADWYVGTGTSLSDSVRAEQYQTNIILGSFLTIALLFTLLFFIYAQNRATMYFALFCMVWFARVGTTGTRVFSVLFPQLDWFAAFRIQYVAIPLSAVLTFAIVNVLFPKILHKPVLYLLYGISTVFTLCFMLMNTVLMRDLLDYVFVVYVIGIVYLTGCIVIRQFILRRKINTEQSIFLVGLLLFFVGALTDMGYFEQLFHTPPFHLTGVAMLVFSLCMAVAVFTSAMKETERIKLKSLKLTAENAALESLTRIKTEFLQDIKHEVRNPLQVISLGAEFINRSIGNPTSEEETRKSIIVVQNEAVRLGNIINGMVEMATMSGVASRKKVNFATMLKDCAESARIPLLQKNITLHIDIAPGLPYVYIEAEQVSRVPVNLIANAANSMETGIIIITAEADERYITVKIRDTGEGIPPDIIPKIFERGISGKGGEGYGLSICKTILEAHGGTIEIQSERGHGTCATFTIPIYGGQGEEVSKSDE
jgi:signal transduction histidine kinase